MHLNKWLQCFLGFFKGSVETKIWKFMKVITAKIYKWTVVLKQTFIRQIFYIQYLDLFIYVCSICGQIDWWLYINMIIGFARAISTYIYYWKWKEQLRKKLQSHWKLYRYNFMYSFYFIKKKNYHKMDHYTLILCFNSNHLEILYRYDTTKNLFRKMFINNKIKWFFEFCRNLKIK